MCIGTIKLIVCLCLIDRVASALKKSELDMRIKLFVVVLLLPVLRIAPFHEELLLDILRISVRLQEGQNSRPSTFKGPGNPATDAPVKNRLRNICVWTYKWLELEASPAKKKS
jgi:hypothetical protein